MSRFRNHKDVMATFDEETRKRVERRALELMRGISQPATISAKVTWDGMAPKPGYYWLVDEGGEWCIGLFQTYGTPEWSVQECSSPVPASQMAEIGYVALGPAIVPPNGPAVREALDEWLNELIGFGLRAEMVPDEAIPWLAEAAEIGARHAAGFRVGEVEGKARAEIIARMNAKRPSWASNEEVTDIAIDVFREFGLLRDNPDEIRRGVRGWLTNWLEDLGVAINFQGPISAISHAACITMEEADAALTVMQEMGIYSHDDLLAVVDETWRRATESEQVPSTRTADRIIEAALEKRKGAGDGQP